MGHKEDGTIEMAALGRPFSLGMLYDCRHEKFIPGLTLWNYDDLVNHIGESPQQHSDFEIVASESIEDKSSALNVEGSLKASLVFGLIELEGSAKYLRDNRTFKNQARVTLKYEATTKFQELSMNHLGNKNVKYPDVFTKGIATHVVTAILYGAQAFFVFDREVSDMINCEEAEGFLRGMIKKIPILEGDLSLKLEEKDFKKVEEFSCKFHGDFLLEKTPSTFQDAIQVYQSLPKLLGANGENAVPVKVWLLPLTSLDPSATKFVYEISDGFVEDVQAVLEDFSELEIRCNDILRATAQQFPQIGKKIETFKEVCSEFRLKFQSDLAKKLPSIRGGGEEEAELAEILKKRRSSPFNSKDLNEWMDCKEREICILKSFTNMMKNTKIVPSQNHLYKETHSAEHAVCFVFTSLDYAEPFLSALSNYLKQTPKTNDTKDPHTDDVEREQWYTSKEVLDAVSHKAKLFSDFAEANKENKNIKFLTVGSTNETQKGSSIYLYKDGRCVNEIFEPPSKSETVTVTKTNHKSVTLKISPPRFGAENITSYSVEYCVSGDDGWKQKTASEAEEVTVSDLSPNTEYMFRCRAVTSAGVGPANEVSGSIKTLPCSPPGKPQVEPTSSEISLSWEKPAEVGQNVHILSYIVEYANKDTSLTEEDLQWSQIMTKAEKAIISGLQPETEYVVRVRCDCGEAGGNKESITVTVCTTQDVQVLQDVLKDLTDLEIRCKDAINSTTVKQFPQIAQKIETFKKLCTDYKLTFPQRLTILRGESKAVVMDMMKMRNSSPFNETDLGQWMDCKEREIHILRAFTDMMKNTKIVPSQNHLYKETHSVEHAVCFVFTSLDYAEPFLSALSNYLKQTPKTNDTNDLHTDDVEREQWYTSKEVLDAVSHKAKLFSDFAEANKENKNIKFLTVGSTNETQKGSSIYLYEDGFSVSENFEPPSKPETVTVTETNHKSVTLKISPPKFGAENITSYSVEYCVSGDDGWKQKTASEAEEVTVSDLSPNTEYMFRCRAVTSAGVGPANEVSGSIKTLPCSPPGKIQSYSSEISLSWEKPAEVGQNVHILSYIVEYAKTDNGMKEEDLQWSQIMTKAEKAIISGLQPETEYVVRVRCDCGEAGGSKESITVTVCTTQNEYVQALQDILKDFTDLEIRCKDTIKSTTVKQFPQIAQKIKTFKKLCTDYKLTFPQRLTILRGESKAVVMDMMKMRNSSPFNERDLCRWMDCKEREIHILRDFTDMMKNTKIIPSQNHLYKETHSAEHAVCFVFTSLDYAEPFLSALSNYLKQTPKTNDTKDPHTDDVEREQWYTSKEVLDAMSHKAKLFSDFAEANKENKNIKFLTVGSTNETQKGSSIYLYEDGFSVSENFELPSKPQTVTVTETNHKSVTLKISPPKFGAENITSYSVEYCVSGDDGWKQKTASEAEEVRVSDLSPNTEYMFRCRAVTSAGVGPANEVSGSIKTLPCSPPGKPQVEQYSSEISVSWEKPAEVGQNVHILSYIVEYAKKDNSLKEEDLQWSQKTAGAERVIISGLQPETEYVVRVRCDCGEAGGSKESITVTVCTTQDVQVLQDVLKDLTDLEIRCKDAINSTTVKQFPQIAQKIETFKKLCTDYKLTFPQRLTILRGESKETVVMDMMKMRNSSPFNERDLGKWMDCKEREIHILRAFTDIIQNTNIVPSEDAFQREIVSAEHAMCFVFTSLGSTDPYLSTLSNYLTETPKPDKPRDPHTDDVEREQWYTSKEVLDAISHKAKLFSDFAEANKENKNIKFLTVGSTNETQKGSSIYLYEDGLSVSENFEPPSKPETVTVTETNHKSVTLKISPPKFGAENITSYSVEYCVSGDDGWKQKTASEAEEVTVSDLSPNTEYMFRCRAVTSAGVGPANEVSGSIKTLPCSPPGKPQVEPSSSEISVSWEKPAEVGQNVHILSYIVEYANKDNSLKEEDLQWSQKMAGAEKVIISGLQPETEYVVRVRCDCGEAGGSKESITVTVCTTQDEYVQALQDVLKDLNDLEIRCKDAINSTTVKQFPQIAQKIETFKKLCTEYKLTFPQRLTILRGESKAVVMDMMKMRNSSPFNERDLGKWMDCKEREIHILRAFTDIIQNTNIVPSQDAFQREIVSAEHAVCFVFISLGSTDSYLSTLLNYLTETPKPDEPRDPHTDDVEREQWYTSKEVLDAMSHKAKLFSDFAEANKENKNIKFLTVGSTNETQKGSSIYLYEDGFSVSENFEPPSKPETVTVTETNHKSVTLKISPPKFGAENITYSVEYCVSGDDGWKQKTASEAEEVTVSDLSPNTEYMFRCRAVTSAGVGPANEVSGSIKTLPCSPPGKPQVEQYSSKISVSWEKPAEVGQNVHILSYIVEYANKDNSLKEEDLQWSQKMAGAERVIISGLQPETEYVVRVRCDCGEAGGSKESITVTVCTTQDVQVLQDVLKDLTDLEIRCKDAINSTTVKQFPQIAQKIETFKKLCTDYKLTFPQRLTILRGESKAVVMDMMKIRNSSPFNETDLGKWMDCKEREIHILRAFTDMMKNTKIVPSQNHLYKETHSAEHAVCFVFTSLDYAEPFLSALSNYLKQTPKTNDTKDPHTDDVEREQWYTSKEVLDAVSHKAKLFSDFAEANKENKNIKFLTVGSTNETQKGSSIYLYEDGFSVSENFEPPSKPETVTVTETNHKSVTLKISPPKFGAENITSYSVEYCVSGDDGWKQKTASEAEEVTVSDLSPNTEYMFRCRAVTSAGVGPAIEVSGSIKTLVHPLLLLLHF